MKKVCCQALGIIVCLCLIITLILAACKKQKEVVVNAEPDPRERFYSGDPADSLVSAVMRSIRRQDMQRDIVPKLVKKAGYPVWEKAIVSQRNDKKIAFVPFVNDKQTKAILLVKTTGTDTFYHMLYGAQYNLYPYDGITKNTWNARDIFHAFMYFDNAVFGTTKFKVFDPRLTYDSIDTRPSTVTLKEIRNLSTTARENTAYLVTVITAVAVCHECGMYVKGQSLQSDDCCNVTYYDLPVSFWFDDSNDTWGWYTPELGGGGGGSTDIRICDNCNWEDTNPCELDEQGHAIGFCDENWQPPTITHPAFNPLLYDSIEVNNLIHDSFPCVYNLLETDMEAINQKTQLLLYSIFDVPLYNHIYFKVNWNFTKDSAIMGTKPFHREWIDDNMHFYDTIEINPYYAIHATKEMLIAAVVHESIHGYINWCFASYTNGQANGIDSFYLREHFPIHWQYFTNRPYDWQHDLMINNYANEIIKAVVAGGNQLSSEQMRTYIGRALAYSGLHQTSAWNTLSQSLKCEYEGIQDWCQDYDKPSNFAYTISGCRNYDRAFRDSLQLSGPCH